MGKLAPIIVFVYNRLEHTMRTFDSLSKNKNADMTDVFIFSDHYKSEKDREAVLNVRKYVSSLSSMQIFKSVSIRESKSNQGLAKSVIEGVSSIINKYGKVIVVEDDLETSNDFIDYMNKALDFYEDSSNIWSICGYSPPIKIPNTYVKDIYLSYRGGSWGWATWIDRWETIDWSHDIYDDFFSNKKMRKKFNLGGRDMTGMLELQVKGMIDSWAIRWCYAQFLQSKYTIYPVKSKVRNIGMDGSGTHSGPNKRFHISELASRKVNLVHVDFDDSITKNFRNHYLSLHKYLLFKFYSKSKIIRYFLKRMKLLYYSMLKKGKSK